MDAIGKENIVGAINDVKGAINTAFKVFNRLAAGWRLAWYFLLSFNCCLFISHQATINRRAVFVKQVFVKFET